MFSKLVQRFKAEMQSTTKVEPVYGSTDFTYFRSASKPAVKAAPAAPVKKQQYITTLVACPSGGDYVIPVAVPVSSLRK